MLWLEIEGNGQSLLMKEGENDKKAGFWVGVTVLVCNPSTCEIKAGEVQSQPPLHSEFQISLGYIR